MLSLGFCLLFLLFRNFEEIVRRNFGLYNSFFCFRLSDEQFALIHVSIAILLKYFFCVYRQNIFLYINSLILPKIMPSFKFILVSVLYNRLSHHFTICPSFCLCISCFCPYLFPSYGQFVLCVV